MQMTRPSPMRRHLVISASSMSIREVHLSGAQGAWSRLVASPPPPFPTERHCQRRQPGTRFCLHPSPAVLPSISVRPNVKGFAVGWHGVGTLTSWSQCGSDGEANLLWVLCRWTPNIWLTDVLCLSHRSLFPHLHVHLTRLSTCFPPPHCVAATCSLLCYHHWMIQYDMRPLNVCRGSTGSCVHVPGVSNITTLTFFGILCFKAVRVNKKYFWC